MLSPRLASKYGEALFGVLGEVSRLGKVLGELEKVLSFIRAEGKRCERLFTAMVVPMAQKEELIKLLVGRLGLSSEVGHFLLVLVRAHRFNLLPAVVDYLLEKKVILEGRKMVRVEVPWELSESQQREVIARLESFLGSRVFARFVVDRSLVAGLRFTVDGKSYNASLSASISLLREELLREEGFSNGSQG